MSRLGLCAGASAPSWGDRPADRLTHKIGRANHSPIPRLGVVAGTTDGHLYRGLLQVRMLTSSFACGSICPAIHQSGVQINCCCWTCARLHATGRDCCQYCTGKSVTIDGFHPVDTINRYQGSGFGNLNVALRDLDTNASRLAESPNKCYHDLFKIQRLVRSALALRFYSGIRAQSAKSHIREDGLHEKALECSTDIAEMALGHIYQILNKKDFQKDVTPPSIFSQQFLALTDHVPPSFGPYHYFYGLLHCAAQLISIVCPNRYPPDFADLIRSIVSTTKETSLRWKAVSKVFLAFKPRMQCVPSTDSRS